MTGRRRMTEPFNPRHTSFGTDSMGLKDWFDRKRRGYTDIDELMNPILAWRLQHFVCLPEDRKHWLRQFIVPSC